MFVSVRFPLYAARSIGISSFRRLHRSGGYIRRNIVELHGATDKLLLPDIRVFRGHLIDANERKTRLPELNFSRETFDEQKSTDPAFFPLCIRSRE